MSTMLHVHIDELQFCQNSHCPYCCSMYNKINICAGKAPSYSLLSSNFNNSNVSKNALLLPMLACISFAVCFSALMCHTLHTRYQKNTALKVSFGELN